MKSNINLQIRILVILIFILLSLCVAYALTRGKASNNTGVNDMLNITDAPFPTVVITEITPLPTATITETTPSTTGTITETTPSPTIAITEAAPSPTATVTEVAPSPSATIIEAAPSPTIAITETVPSPISPSPADNPIIQDLEQLKANLEEYISLQDGRYGLYFINLETGEEFGINDKDVFIAASTTKLPMNLLLYKKIAAGKIKLGDMLTYLEEDFEPGTGIIQKTPYGTEYTVRETARLSVVYSDNCGINMIIRLLGIDNIREYMLEIGGTIYYGPDHRTCPYDLAIYAKELYDFYQQEPEVAGILIEDLQNTIWNDRINKLLPRDIKVSHKIGNYPSVYNDVGIVFASQPYALAVMSEDIEQSVASEVIAQLSKTIYDYIITLD